MELILRALPTWNASLNFLAAIFLGLGYHHIRQGNRVAHKTNMNRAFLVSAIFLASYLYYHFHVPPRPFVGPAFWKGLYYLILFPHILLATANLPFIFRLFWLARKEDFEKHKRLARWVWPIWMYVSVTGVLVYILLYWVSPRFTPEFIPQN